MLKLSGNALGMLAAKYRAVLKNMRFKGAGFLAACCLLTLAPAGALAADIIYTGDNIMLKITPYWAGQLPNSLFPFDNGSGDPIASGNTVTVNYSPNSGSTTNPSYVFGGLGQGAVTGNTVNILKGEIGDSTLGVGSVYGGYSDNTDGIGEGTADDNTVNISGGTIYGDVYGGASIGDTADGNIVNISGGTIGSNVYGGYSDGESSTANGNTVNIFGGTIGVDVYGGYSTGYLVTNNNVNILGDAEVTGDIYGGYSNGYVGSSTVNILDNAVINGNIYGGYSNNGNASNNDVHILGGTFDNTIEIYGGYSKKNNATDNTVILAGSPDLASTNIFGGYSIISAKDTFTENFLIVSGYKTTASINNFEHYSFILPASMTDGETLLQTDSWTNSRNTPITVKGIGIESGGTPLKPGETVNLIEVDAAGIFPTNDLSSPTAIGQKGIALFYNFDLDMGDITTNVLSATVSSVSAHPQTKALSEGRLATIGFLNQGADLIAGEGITDALSKVKSDGEGAFGALSYGSSRYKTGSHADVEGVNLLTGIAWKRQMDKSSLLTGVFLEGGWGNYNTYNNYNLVDNKMSINSGGDASYYGLGVLARRDLASGSYVEGSVRGGKSKTTFSSNDFLDNIFDNTNVSYTSNPTYYGAHIGIGRVKAKGINTVDYYAKYFYTHQGGDDITVADDPLSFSSSDSSRLRGGVRLTNNRPDGRIATYYGAAYEYEFDGKVNASTYGYDIDAPSLKGSTGILELGMRWKNRPDSANSLNLTLQGYVGKRQGLSGTVEFKRVF